MANMDDIIRRLVEEPYTVNKDGLQLYPGLLGNITAENTNNPMTVEGVDINQQAPVNFQGGVIGQTPATQMTPVDNTAQQTLDAMKTKNQENQQQMLQAGQQGIQQAMQASQGLQQQRQSQMAQTQQQAQQAAAKAQQEEEQAGQMIGTLARMYFTGGF